MDQCSTQMHLSFHIQHYRLWRSQKKSHLAIVCVKKLSSINPLTAQNKVMGASDFLDRHFLLLTVREIYWRL